MPIRAENRGRYPKDWKAISLRIRNDRAQRRCECTGECGAAHVGGRCLAYDGLPHPETKAKVVLTVAHLDHTPENCADENLRALCQRCHNRYDAPTRAAGVKERREAASPQTKLFGGVS